MNKENLIVGKFKLEICFQLTNRPFFLCGEISTGEFLRGYFLDLSPVGLSKQIRIEEIEFIRKNKNGDAREITALGTRELNESDKLFLQETDSFPLFDILKERSIHHT